MASETVAIPVTTDVIEVPAENKTIVVNPTSDVAIVPEVNGTATTAATTEVVAEETPKEEEKKVIDPREDAIGWIKSLIPAGVHKANHQVLTWIQNVTFPAEEARQPLPGKDEAVTKNQFLNFLKDGTLLAKFANVLSPGSIETVYDGEEAKTKENQTANVANFIKFVQEKAGLTEAETFTVDDLQEKGKAGYDAVFNTLFQLGLKAQEKFSAAGFDVDAVVEAASQAAKNSVLQAIWNFFKRVRPQLKSKTSDASTTEEKPHANGNNGVSTTTVEETTNVVVPVTNGDATKVTDDIPPPVPTTAAPAVVMAQ